MARLLPPYLANVRHLLVALLAIGLVLRLGSACEAMAATPAAPAAHQSHCADMPAKPDKPVKSEAAACAMCVTLPAKLTAPAANVYVATANHTQARQHRLAGMSGGPAPPPPRIA